MAVEKDIPLVEEELTAEKLISGDRPSVYMFGLVGAQALRQSEVAVFMVDVLGRVQVMPPGAIQVLQRPRVSEEDLMSLAEDDAIRVMTAQGDSDEVIMEHLRSRNAVENL